MSKEIEKTTESAETPGVTERARAAWEVAQALGLGDLDDHAYDGQTDPLQLLIEELKAYRLGPIAPFVVRALAYAGLGDAFPCSHPFYDHVYDEVLELELPDFWVFLTLNEVDRKVEVDLWRKGDDRDMISQSGGDTFGVSEPELDRLCQHIIDRTSSSRNLKALSSARVSMEKAYDRLTLAVSRLEARDVTQRYGSRVLADELNHIKMQIEALSGLSYRMTKMIAHFEVADKLLGERLYLVGRLPHTEGKPLFLDSICSDASRAPFRVSPEIEDPVQAMAIPNGFTVAQALAKLSAAAQGDGAFKSEAPRLLYEVWSYTPATGAWELKHTTSLRATGPGEQKNPIGGET
jgi:hypothetical protein